MATGSGAAYEAVPTAPGRASATRWWVVRAPQVGAPSLRRTLLYHGRQGLRAVLSTKTCIFEIHTP
eukprot:5109086-Prymnesium_polylepis.1